MDTGLSAKISNTLPDYWVSEKLDGVRGYWDGEKLLTRGGKSIAAPAWSTAGWPRVPLDGKPARRFKLGTGFSHAERQDPPALGALVTYRFRGLNDSGIPRFASFMRVREEPLR
ncbi:MAG: hypothetical protein Q8K05_07005 [Polaromonas sp.]|uniref:hypothetical protein n=1 Tax=Polaromonas sp. TaxID=1869339 RepID=UPI0027307032|nr:hypothetical protein [Polaromonas sp.]MDP2255791.1 hypothetical protein [Polaromonas sp.]